MPAVKDVRRAALDTLVAYLVDLEVTPGVAMFTSVVNGWPEFSQTQDLGAGAMASVAVSGKPKVMHHAPVLVSETAGGTGPAPTSTGLYCVGTWSATIQVDMWSDYKETLDALAMPFREALSPNFPWKPGLDLPMDDYYGEMVGLTDYFAEDPPQAQSENQRSGWRLTWLLTMNADLYREFTAPRQTVIQLVTTTSVSADPTTEAEVTVEVFEP